MQILEQIAWDKLQNGLIPAIAQDYQTNEILMLAFMDKEVGILKKLSNFFWIATKILCF